MRNTLPVILARRPPRWLLLLVLAGSALIFVAIFIPYEQADVGGTKLTVDRTTVWAALEPFMFAVGSVLAVSGVYSRSTALASGLLLGFGVGAVVFYGASIGRVSLSEYPWSLREGNFVGLLGALMVLGTGGATLPRSRSMGPRALG